MLLITLKSITVTMQQRIAQERCRLNFALPFLFSLNPPLLMDRVIHGIRSLAGSQLEDSRVSLPKPMLVCHRVSFSLSGNLNSKLIVSQLLRQAYFMCPTFLDGPVRKILYILDILLRVKVLCFINFFSFILIVNLFKRY